MFAFCMLAKESACMHDAPLQNHYYYFYNGDKIKAHFFFHRTVNTSSLPVSTSVFFSSDTHRVCERVRV